MESQTAGDGSPLLNLPFDHYHRYQLTQRLVSLLWPRRKDRILKILDVGGHSSPLKNFLPTHVVVLLDIQLPGSLTTMPFTYDTYLIATGTKLPLADLSFDLVTANDTLEHLPDADRPAFLQELLRVSRRFVILNGPTYHEQTAEAEQRFARFMSRALFEKSDFLQEHIDLGLPKEEDIEKVLNGQGLPFLAIPNGNLALWLAMNTAKNYVRAFPDADRLSRILDQTYNLVLSPRDFGGLCYRKAYVITKSRGDAKALQRVQAAFSPLLERPPAPDNVGALEALVAGLEEHASAVRGHIASIQDALADKQEWVQAALADKDRHITNIENALTDTQAVLVDKDQHIANIETLLTEKEENLTHRDRHIASLETALDETEEQLREVRQQFQVATSTLGYRLLERARAVVNRLAPPGTRRRGVLKLPRQGLRIILTEGWGSFLRRAVRVWRWGPRTIRRARIAAQVDSLDERYQLWLRAHALTPARVRRIRKEAAGLSYRPKVSIIMPVYNPDSAWLRAAIESVRGQLYDNWELCIADDASSGLAARALLQEYQGDERIKVAYLKENQGISGASNAALAMAAGEYAGFLDHDDELKPDALYEVVKLLNEQPDLDFIYSDEDKRSPEGRLVEPFFKPDWSPDLLLSTNYVPHFAVYRKRVVDEVGGLRSECDFSQDYDLVLRVTERTNRIGHVALPLYAWRMVPGSAALDLEAKPKSIDAAKRALADAMQRRGIQAQVTDGLWISTYRIRYRILGEPLVSIIVPTKDRVRMLARCIDSIRRKTGYKNYEILVVDNGSVEDRTHKYLRGLAQQPGIRVLDYPQPFNFSAINNFAAQHARGEHLLFLNNDTEVISKEWLSALLEHSQRPEVGAVGARLLYADGRLQHGGVIVGLGGVAGHAHKLLPKGQNGYFVRAKVIQNFSAVTAACLMIRADLFTDLGGFDGEHLPIAFGDVDLCLRIREQGLLVVWTPYAELYHHESASRGYEDTPEKQRRFGREMEYMKAKWGDTLLNDPYYSPNLTQDREDFSLRP